MSLYEFLSSALALVALGISGYTLLSQRRLQAESNNLQRATSDLAKKQLELIVREDTQRQKAHVKIDLVKESRTSFRFVITNIGAVVASDVNVDLLLDDPKHSPLIAGECREKLPAPKLPPGSSFTLIAALHMGSPLSYRAKLSWKNPDGSETVDETFVSL